MDKENGEKMKKNCRGIILNIEKKAEESLCILHGFFFVLIADLNFFFT